MANKIFEIIKENTKRMYSISHEIKKYFYELLFLFCINVGFILYATTAPEKFSLKIFIALWLVSAIILVRIFHALYHENISKNLPCDFDYEYKIRNKPMHEIKTAITFIGHIHMRGFYGRIYVYPDEIVIRFLKKCLIVKNPQNVKVQKFLFRYLADFAVDDKFVQCSLNSEKALLLEEWLKKREIEF